MVKMAGKSTRQIQDNAESSLQRSDLSFATADPREILKMLNTSENGLTHFEAKKRQQKYGLNEISRKKKSKLQMLFEKFQNPLLIVLLIVSIISYYFGQELSAIIIVSMVVISALMSFLQEYSASTEVEKLQELVRTTVAVYREGKIREMPIWELVPGDLVSLAAGDLVPADLRIYSSKDLFINQASITGEAFPVEKNSLPLRKTTGTGTEFGNIAFMGSNVVSGSAIAVVIRTGEKTQFGELAKKVTESLEVTAFDKGISEFTSLMIKFMVVLVVAIFLINGLMKNNFLEALLFSLAIAVGLTPEMLPVIITVNLAKGATDLSKKKVIVKRLSAIQNLGGIDILCSDKTGTLTEGEVILEKHLDVNGKESADVLDFAFINSFYHTGLNNLLDKAILKYEHLKHERIDAAKISKIDEIPFDFERKMMSVVVNKKGKHLLITKGAPDEVLKRCKRYEVNGVLHKMASISLQDGLLKFPQTMSLEGFRVLAVAYREMPLKKKKYRKEDESDLVLMGFMLFLDPPKPSSRNIIRELEELKIGFKILTGDNELVTEEVCRKIGLPFSATITGEKISNMSDTDLQKTAERTTIFARLTPMQKERVIIALKRNGHTVGYLGDGINDAQALKASDVGISVNNAADIAKESADIILLHKSLEVLKDGVVDGRRVFSNIQKYIRMGSSSNFGNMISFTGASIFLPFLPMTSAQLLVNNFFYDVSQLAIPTDNVDADYVKKPHPWNIEGIKRFMLNIGPISSIFDFATFGVLMYFNTPVGIFQTCWFFESLCTQTLAIHVIRTEKIPFIESKPSKWLILMSLAVILAGYLLITKSIGSPFGFISPPAYLLWAIAGIVLLYLFTLHVAKTLFIRKYGNF
jgi:P-type Mg2+ transporter